LKNANFDRFEQSIHPEQLNLPDFKALYCICHIGFAILRTNTPQDHLLCLATFMLAFLALNPWFKQYFYSPLYLFSQIKLALL
jgi:hypothetical protein